MFRWQKYKNCYFQMFLKECKIIEQEKTWLDTLLMTYEYFLITSGKRWIKTKYHDNVFLERSILVMSFESDFDNVFWEKFWWFVLIEQFWKCFSWEKFWCLFFWGSNIDKVFLISLVCHEQVCLMMLSFERCFSHHRKM